jgi:alkanesulfonate monooxygenase SsuD/methylene tetrahydromethanopterin reductase-like flavin-dependent oxidoreductase (luciferase family)
MESVLTLAESVEEAGYDSVWVGDSLLASPRPEAITTLAAIAARTRKLRLGSGILISALRHPVHLAHQLATVDLISGGRLTVGIGYSSGTGLWKLEHEVVGINASSRHARAREGIDVMRKLWRHANATHRGKFFSLDDIRLLPKPAQEGGPPIWLHGMRGNKTLRRVAQCADGWINNLATPEEFAAGWSRILAHAADLGRDATRLTACHYSTIRIGTDGAVAQAKGREFMSAYYGGMSADEIEQIECCRYGTPEMVGDSLASFIAAGATTLVIRFASDNQQEQIELCTERLLPVLKAASVAP